MDKTRFIKHLAQTHQRPQTYYARALDDILRGITEQLHQGKEVRFLGFGVFTTTPVQERVTRNVRTGEPLTVPAHRRAFFRVGEALKRAVRAS